MVFTMVGAERDTLHVAYYETKLRKQGIIGLTLSNAADLAKIHDDDTLDIVGLHDCCPGDSVMLIVHHPDQTTDEIQACCA